MAGILLFWDQLVWPLLLPIFLAWMAWAFLEMVLHSPPNISSEHALTSSRFARLAKQSLILFWCCWQWGILFHIANSNFRFTSKVTDNGSLFDAAMTEFVTASALMHPIFWYTLALLFSLFVAFLIARR